MQRIKCLEEKLLLYENNNEKVDIFYKNKEHDFNNFKNMNENIKELEQNNLYNNKKYIKENINEVLLDNNIYGKKDLINTLDNNNQKENNIELLNNKSFNDREHKK